MRIELDPGIVLTTEHSASSYGVPVLVESDRGIAYGPADLVPFGGESTAAEYVRNRCAELNLMLPAGWL